MKKAIAISLCIYIFNIYGQDIISWNKDRKLFFDDFKAIPPTETIFGAVSSVIFDIKFNSQREEVNINSLFVEHKSWFKDKTLKPLLNHEQRHFDIVEISARKTRKLFSETYFTYNTFDSLYNQILSISNLQYSTMQDIYEIETDLSRNIECQEEWNKYIDQMLQELEAYSNPIVKLKFKEDEED